MTGGRQKSGGEAAPYDADAAQGGMDQIIKTADVDGQAKDAFASLLEGLGYGPFELIILFASPDTDFEGLCQHIKTHHTEAKVIGCSTAGEITSRGYEENKIVALGLPQAYFDVETHLIAPLDKSDFSPFGLKMVHSRRALALRRPKWEFEFNFLLVDGLSLYEDQLVSALAMGLGPVPLFGGSAGDGNSFEKTKIIYNSSVHENAAVLTQVRTLCPIKVFKTDHLIPAEERMVVTKADPKKRIVHEINANSAAREYARLLGKDPDQLSPFTFAAHPVVVRLGGQHHVRAIQRVDENGDLIFFSAIDEGVVLTLAEAEDMEKHLATSLKELTQEGRPDVILGCDCILRRLEAMQKQKLHALSALFAKHRVVGFSTYGEQFNSMHVNQTLTGVAIYPPKETKCPAD